MENIWICPHVTRPIGSKESLFWGLAKDLRHSFVHELLFLEWWPQYLTILAMHAHLFLLSCSVFLIEIPVGLARSELLIQWHRSIRLHLHLFLWLFLHVKALLEHLLLSVSQIFISFSEFWHLLENWWFIVKNQLIVFLDVTVAAILSFVVWVPSDCLSLTLSLDQKLLSVILLCLLLCSTYL